MCKEYNGYTNYETWNVSLWIDNDQGLYDTVQELTASAIGEDHPRYYLQSAIKNLIEEDNPLADDCSMFRDLLQAALDSVNWYEIADNWIEVAREQMEGN